MKRPARKQANTTGAKIAVATEYEVKQVAEKTLLLFNGIPTLLVREIIKKEFGATFDAEATKNDPNNKSTWVIGRVVQNDEPAFALNGLCDQVGYYGTTGAVRGEAIFANYAKMIGGADQPWQDALFDMLADITEHLHGQGVTEFEIVDVMTGLASAVAANSINDQE